MSNEHIGRLQAIGLGPESTSGTAVSASVWIPKQKGILKPVHEQAKDDSGYGVIDEAYDSQTVKNMTEVSLEGIVRDNFIGHFFRGAMGTYTPVFCATLASVTGGTPARGDVVSSAASSWAGVIRKIIIIGAVTYYFISTTSGSLTSGSVDFTNGTWTATVTTTAYAAVKGHLFTRLNTNNHPAFTMYGYDPVGSFKAPYCMVDSFETEFSSGNYETFNCVLKGKKMVSASAQSPVYTADNPLLAKFTTVKFAASESALNAATAIGLQRFKLTINKNLTEIQNLGDVDVASLHNQHFTMAGDMEAIYTDTTLLDYVGDSTKKACRVAAVNNSVTALYSSGGDSIYPSVYYDIAKSAFTEWSRGEDNNNLTNQTLGFEGEFSVGDAMTLEVLLLNSNATGYAA